MKEFHPAPGLTDSKGAHIDDWWEKMIASWMGEVLTAPECGGGDIVLRRTERRLQHEDAEGVPDREYHIARTLPRLGLSIALLYAWLGTLSARIAALRRGASTGYEFIPDVMASRRPGNTVKRGFTQLKIITVGDSTQSYVRRDACLSFTRIIAKFMRESCPHHYRMDVSTLYLHGNSMIP